jgi:hypothetical protein
VSTIKANYPYTDRSDRVVEIGKPHRGGETKHIYVSVTEEVDGVDAYEDRYSHAVAHLSYDRARELAYAILAEIGDTGSIAPVPGATYGEFSPPKPDLPDVGDLPLDYALDVVQRFTQAAR